jgi:hypothetical protein
MVHSEKYANYKKIPPVTGRKLFREPHDDVNFYPFFAYMHSLHSKGVSGKQVLFSEMTLLVSLPLQHSEVPEPESKKIKMM